MAALLILGLAIGFHGFLLISSIKGYQADELTLLFPVLVGSSLLFWVVSIFSVSGIFKKVSKGQDTSVRKEGGQETKVNV